MYTKATWWVQGAGIPVKHHNYRPGVKHETTGVGVITVQHMPSQGYGDVDGEP